MVALTRGAWTSTRRCRATSVLLHHFLLPEGMYGEAMAFALRDRGLTFDRERQLVVRYRNRVIGHFRADFVIDGQIIVELKAADAIVSAHESQVLNYLRASALSVGLILNFGAKAGIRRVIWTGRDLVRSSS